MIQRPELNSLSLVIQGVILASLGAFFGIVAYWMRSPLAWLLVLFGVGGYAWEARKRWVADETDEMAEQIAHLSSHITKQLALAVSLIVLAFAMASRGKEASLWVVPIIATLILPDRLLRSYLSSRPDEPVEDRRARDIRRIVILVGCSLIAAAVAYCFIAMSDVLASFDLSWIEFLRSFLGE